jgi:beta-phosphoglucomutase-like phosphatase (HAD superfamily)
MIKAYLFDLDGTLQDTETLYVEAWQRAYEERHCQVSHAEACSMVYGRAKNDVFTSFHARFPAPYPDIRSLDEPLTRHFLSLRSTRDIRIPGSIALLERLADRYLVAIVSGNSRRDIAESVNGLGIGSKLAFFLGCEDYSPGKPDPACFLLAARRLQLQPSECLVFEDSAAGLRAAKAAGMACVALSRPGSPPQDLSPADCILTDLALFEPPGN